MLPAVLHQPRRRHAHDRARLPRRRHAHALLRRRGPQAAAAARRTASIPTSTASRPTSSKRAKLLVINYPNSPTGAVATRDFYQRVIDFAHTQPDRRRAGRRPHPAELRRPAAELPAGRRGEGGRRRGALDVEGLQHDRLAHGFVCGHPKIVQAFADVKDNCDSRPVHGDPAGRRGGAASTPEIADARPREVSPPAAEAGRGAEARSASRRRCRAAPTSSTRGPEGRRRPHLRQRRGGVAVPDPRAVGLLRAVGRRRGVPALLGDVPREGRGGGRRADGGDGARG